MAGVSPYPNPFNRVWLDSAIEQRPTRPMLQQNYLGLKFFPMKRVNDYQLTWDLIKSGNRLAGLYAHDGVPTPGPDYDFEQLVADIMHIMANRTVSPDVVMKLRQAGEPSVSSTLIRSLRQKLLGHVAEKLANCQDEVEAVIEYLCMHALQGTIVWPPVNNAGAAITPAPASWGDVSFTLSMGFRATFVQNVSTLAGWGARAGGGAIWSNTAACDPILDLEVIAELIQETTGLSAWGSTVIMSRVLLSYIARAASVLLWVRGSTGPPPDQALKFIDMSTLKDYLQTRLGYNIVLYDAIWTYPTNLGSGAGVTENQVKFLREGRVLIIPPGALSGGNAYFATAPDLGAPNGENLGLYTWSHQQPTPPWVMEIGCGVHGFPILKSSQEIFVLNALS